MYALFCTDEKRSKAAFFKLIDGWCGILISDDFWAYIQWEYGRQTCLAHLMRGPRNSQ
ncbi:MAG: transposase [Desulfovibrionaceae bacterium]|nr:transposase [Desulfovibrionaceae bacterium]